MHTGRFSARFRLLTAIAVLAVAAVGRVAGQAAGITPVLADWLYAPGPGTERAAPGFDDSAWERVTLPKNLPMAGGELWLRTELDPGAVPDGLYLLFSRMDAAAEVYLDGALVGQRGFIAGKLAYKSNQLSAAFLPPALLPAGRPVTLALRIAALSSATYVPVLRLGGAAAVLAESGWISLLNLDINSMLATVLVVIGIYFLLLWIGNRSDATNLWYAMASLTISYYFFDMGGMASLLPLGLNRAFAKSCLLFSMAGLCAFFLEYFRLRRPRWLVLALFVLPALNLALMLSAAGDTAKISRYFDISLPLVQVAIVFIVVVTIRGVIRGDREALPLLVGVALGVGFGTHDVVYKFGGFEPVAWLQGLGFFCLNLSLFVTLTLRSVRQQRELAAYSAAAERGRSELADFVARLETTADAVSELTLAIDRDADAAAGSAEKLAAAADRIGGNADRQAASTEAAAAAVGRWGGSLGSVRSGVASQAAGVNQAAAAVALVAREAAAVAGNAERTGNFAEGLEKSTAAGRQAAQELDEAIARIREAVSGIGEIVEAVVGFAEQTNLLAMNAAIEAAHAGNAGRGFSVIAVEIKTLAAGSAAKAARIRDAVNDIGKRIGAADAANARLRAVIAEVAAGAGNAVAAIAEVGASVRAQRTASDDLRATLGALAGAAAAIAGEVDGQDSDGRDLGARMEELTANVRDLRSAIAGAAAENQAIAESVRRLAQVSRDGKTAAQGLRDLLASHKR